MTVEIAKSDATSGGTSASQPAGASDGLPPPRRRLALLAIGSAIALSTVSLGGVSVALPEMARNLGLAPATAVWLVSGFQLVLLATLLPFAALGERWGYRRVFVGGLLLIAIASVACARSRSFEMLLLARILQGVGASAVMSVNPALLRLSVPTARLGQALGVNAMVVATATALGPSLAAFVLSIADWTWLFLLNLPWAALALTVGAVALPEARPASERRFDAVGAMLNVATFVLLASALDGLAAHGVAALPVLLAGVVCAVGFVAHQRRRPAPLLPLDLLREAVVRRCVGASIFAFAAQMAALVALPFLLHGVFGRDMTTTGLMMMAWPLAVALMAPVAGWLEGRHLQSWSLCVGGGAILAVALAALAAMPAGTGNAALVAAMTLCGIGFGCFQTPNNRAMLGATPRERSGGAGGMQATARLMGQMLGASAVGMAYRLAPLGTTNAEAWALAAAAAFAAASACFSLHRRQA